MNYLKSSIYFTLLLSLFSCESEDSTNEQSFIQAEYGKYIASYTAGSISVASSIIIQLNEALPEEILSTEPPSNLFQFEPAIEGEVLWVDPYTIQYTPKNWLKANQAYQINFALGKILDVPSELQEMTYTFQTLQQDFTLDITGLETIENTELKKMKIHGLLYMADKAKAASVEKMLAAQQEGETKQVSWEHLENGLEHRFTIEQVDREDKSTKLSLDIQGEPVGAERSEQRILDIPAIGDFTVTGHKVIQTGEQHVIIQFSDPLLSNQNPEGLITIEGIEDLSFDINGNEIRVYPSNRLTGSRIVKVFSGIKNVLGMDFLGTTELVVAFEAPKPAVKIEKSGNILPGGEQITLPFQAVALKAVEVQIIKIFSDNIPQFLQSSKLEGNSEIRRVGRIIKRETIPLKNTGGIDLMQWNTFQLDLSDLIEKDPGSLYRVMLRFRKNHSIYVCADEFEDEDVNTSPPFSENDGFSSWEGYEDYYFEDNWTWRERDDPCSSSYYGDRRSASRNILQSSIGIIAKRNNGNKMTIWLNDLLSVKPISGATVQLLNFQNQEIATGSTDSDGNVSLDFEQQPYLLIAEKDGNRSYLRVDDGSALSLSNFDTGGRSLQEGLKGFIYTERGVWRPGDSLHIGFILEDAQKNLPKDYPVVLEIRDPLGKVAIKQVSTKSNNGFYHFGVKTREEDPTGRWTSTIRLGKASFTKVLRIETVKPNRLKIDLDFEQERISSKDLTLKAELSSRWLHGATSGNLRTELEANLSPMPAKFEGYEKYSFTDISQNYSGDNFMLYEGTVDAEGKAKINYQLKKEGNTAAAQKLQIAARVFESSGNFSIRNFSIPVYPYNSYIGIKTPEPPKGRYQLASDTTHKIQLVSLNPEGKKGGNQLVDVSLTKVDWRWWWDRSGRNTNYVAANRGEVVKRDKIYLRNGQGSWDIRINYPDWGRYYLRACDPNSGHCSGKIIYLDWPDWMGRSRRDGPGGATLLSFNTDKDDYETGESMRIEFEGSANSRALISIENGKKVLQSQWVDVQKGDNAVDIDVTSEMAPNIFVHITMLQPHAQSKNDLPIRLYGVRPISVKDPSSILKPILKIADSWSPEKEAIIKVSEAEGRKMTYTVAVVDEGLLDLTNFNTPSPWNYFYAKEAMGVKTWDIYNDVMGASSGIMERLLAIGGDDEIETPEDKTNLSRFEPVVKYFGPYTLEKGKTREHRFTMPNYVGSVKTMLIAGNEGSYGSTEAITPVKQDLMILGSLPRSLGLQEKVSLPVNLFLSDKIKGKVNLKVTTNEQFSNQTVQTDQVNVSSQDMVNFELSTASIPGIGQVNIEASSGGESAKHPINIPVYNPNPVISRSESKLLNKDQSWTQRPQLFGTIGSNELTLEVSTIQPVDFERRLKELISYPHGCVEQVSSSVFPQLYISSMIEMDAGKFSRIKTNIQEAIRILQDFQQSSGAMSYWRGQSYISDWGTTYAGHFLTEARKLGYTVPDAFYNKWLNYQKQSARTWQRDQNYRYDDLSQAYRLYTLALAGNPETSAMNRLRESGALTVAAAWRLAAAYAIIGQKSVADQLINKAGSNVSEYRELGNNFGSSTRDIAMMVETLAIMKEYSKGATLLQKLSEKLSGTDWMSTQSTAFSLLAISKYFGDQDIKSDFSFSYSIDNRKNTMRSELPLVQIPIEIEGGSAPELSIKNSSGKPIYARLISTGKPLRNEEKTGNEGIEMKITYRDMDGNPINIRDIKQGATFISEVKVTNRSLEGRLKNMALSHIFPSGWEIINNRLNGFNSSYTNSNFDYQDIRDRAVYTYFGLNRGETKTFYVQINAAFKGEFYMPATKCEAMYDGGIQSIIAGYDVSVQ